MAASLMLGVLMTAKPRPAQAGPLLAGCQCTDYVYSQRPDIAPPMGNANQWITSAARRGYSYDQIPQVGDVAVFLNGVFHFSAAYGHVAMVTWVNDARTQYNIAGYDGLMADCQVVSYSNLTITSDVWFIHQGGGAPSQPPALPPSASSSGSVEFNPPPPVAAGESVSIDVKVQPGSDFRAARLLIDYQVVAESSTTEFTYTWNTASLAPSVHNIRIEIASRDDADWIQPYSQETTYLLREAVAQSNRSPNSPSPVSPADGQTLDASPQLCWKNNGDPDGDPTMTRVEVWGTGSWISPWLEGNNPCWAPLDRPSGQYSWAVRARDDKGAESAASGAWRLTLAESTSMGVGSSWTRPADEMVMVFVPAGRFVMGSYGGWEAERPVHSVLLDAFWIDQTEVTNSKYQLCMAEDHCRPPRENQFHTREGYFENPRFLDYPVTSVGWDDANTYCKWASARLPTEAEWEKAARGIDESTYPWGEGIDCSYANFGGPCYIGNTTQVGIYERGASPYGTYDMAGNVNEWVNDWADFEYYATQGQDALNPQGPANQRGVNEHVFRGGSWGDDALGLRSWARDWADVYEGNLAFLGFRCARTP